MSRDREPENLTALSDPVGVHSGQVDRGGLDLASLLHATAKVVCDRLGVPCGCQANLPEGKCIATYERCPHAIGDGSGKAYASEAAGTVVPAVKPSGKK